MANVVNPSSPGLNESSSGTLGTWSWVLAAIAFAALPYGLCHLGLDMTDSPYHLNNASHFKRFAPTVLSYWVIGKWREVVGPSLMATRYFAVLLLQLAGLIVLAAVQAPLRRKAAAFAAISLFISTRYYIALGYDEVSTLFLAATLASLIRAISTHGAASRLWVAMAGLASAGAILARLPNCLVAGVCVLALFMLACRDKWRLSWAMAILPALYITAMLLAWSACLAAIYGGIGQACATFVQNLSGLNSSYGLINLLVNYAVHTIILFWWLGLALLAETGFKWTERLRHRTHLTLLALTGVVILFIGSLLLRISPYFPDMALLLFVVMGFHSRDVLRAQWLVRKGVSVDGVLIATVLLFSLIPVAGSNTGLLKLGSGLYLPVVSAVYWPRIARATRLLAISAGLTAVLCIPAQRLMAQYEDAPAHLTRSTVDHPRLKGIFTTPQRKTFIEAVLQDVETQTETPLFVGKLRHGFEFLVDADFGCSRNFWSDLDDPSYVRQVQDALQDRRPESVYIVPQYENDVLPPTNNGVEALLNDQGYQLGISDKSFRRYNRLSSGTRAQ